MNNLQRNSLHNFKPAMATKLHLENELSLAGKKLRDISGGGAMGLTPDHIKTSPAWQLAYHEMDRARKLSQYFNREFLRIHKKEYKRHRDEVRKRT